jgi:kynurenine/2-aminoadipate aminotransferase
VLHAVLHDWGDAGFEMHVQSLQATYFERRDALVQAMKKHLTGLASFEVPSAGMFVWMKVEGLLQDGIDSSALIDSMMEEALVVMVPGHGFSPCNEACPYFRLTFATANIEDFDPAMQRVAAVLRKRTRADTMTMPVVRAGRGGGRPMLLICTTAALVIAFAALRR